MKKCFLRNVFACLAGVVIMGSTMAFAEIETKVGMEVWGRQAWTLQADRSMNISTNVLSKSGTWIERAYLTINPKLTDDLSFRFTFDMNGGTGNSWVKYAYLQYTLPMLSDLTLYAGMVKNYFGTIDSWTYQMFDKDLVDDKAVTSADNGVAAYYYLPMGLGACSFNVVDGRKYKSPAATIASANTNLHPQYVANVYVTPLVGLTLGGSATYQYASDFVAPKSPAGQEKNNVAYVLYGKYVYGPAELQLQCLEIDRAVVRGSTMYTPSLYYRVMTIFYGKSVLETLPLELVVCADFEDSNARNDGFANRIDGKFKGTIGLNYEFSPGVIFQLQYQRYAPETRIKNATTLYVEGENYGISDTIVAQFKVAFDSTIK